MILYTHPTTPFGRHVLMAIHVLRLFDKVTIRETVTANEEPDFVNANPLAKIPTLVTSEGTFYDSRVILDYLNFSSDLDIFPTEKVERFKGLTKLARVIGILDAAVLIVYEGKLRPKEKFVESIVEHQRRKILRGLHQINVEIREYRNGEIPDAAEIGLACCLDYLDFRKVLEWQKHVPELMAWIKSFSSVVPGYSETHPLKAAR